MTGALAARGSAEGFTLASHSGENRVNRVNIVTTGFRPIFSLNEECATCCARTTLATSSSGKLQLGFRSLLCGQETEYGALYQSCDPAPFDHQRIPGARRRRGFGSLMFQATSALALASRLSPACISVQELATTTALSKFTSRVGKLC